ncbi:MAG: Branched-chain amino acid transport ATP-binding protein LivG, partial [uncultured Solirubrobacteraceae bacterium]
DRARRHAHDGNARRRRRQRSRAARDDRPHEAVRRPDGGQRGVLRGPRARHRLDHRPQRRRQDDVLQHAHRPLQADNRRGALRRARRNQQAPRPDHRDGGRADVPEHPPVRDHERRRERPGGPARAHARLRPRIHPAHAGSATRGARRPREGPRAARLRGGQVRLLRPRRRAPRLRRSAPRGDRASAGLGSKAAAARRADRRHEPTGDGPADRLHAPAARRAQPRDPAHRARHEGRHGRLGAGDGARPRREDRRRPAAGGARRSARRRGLPREAGL